MNCVLIDLDGMILESNLDNTANLIDHKFETVVDESNINDGADWIYLKIKADEVQFFAFHNIYASSIKIETYDADDNLIPELSREDSAIVSRARTCFDVKNEKRRFAKANFLMEFPKWDNAGGYAKIYIKKYEGKVSIGRMSAGVPVELGFLNWNYTIGMETPTLPIINQKTGVLVDSYIISYEKLVSFTVNSFDKAKSFDYIEDVLDSLSQRIQEEFIIDYDENGDPVTEIQWVSRKWTFIEHVHTKSIIWAGIENYNFTFLNSVTTQLDINLKGFKK